MHKVIGTIKSIRSHVEVSAEEAEMLDAYARATPEGQRAALAVALAIRADHPLFAPAAAPAAPTGGPKAATLRLVYSSD